MSDLIDRQAALEAMDTWDKFGCDPDGKLVRYDDDKHYVPYVHYEDMVHAIKHLPSAQPEKRTEECTETHASDLISRRTAQRLFAKALTYQEHVGRYKWITAEMKQWIADFIEDLPSAQPQRKGRWMRKNDGVYCSACYKGWDFMTGVPAEVETEYKFCPNCGADMRTKETDYDYERAVDPQQAIRDAYKHGKSKGIKRGMAIARRKHEEQST